MKEDASYNFNYDRNINGVIVNDLGVKNTTSAAIASLHIALKNYFETYQISRSSFVVGEQQLPESRIREENFAKNNLEYHEKNFEVIFHFHHFIELVVKDVLRDIDPLYATKIDPNDISTLIQIREGIVSDFGNTVEFTIAIKRLMSLKDKENEPPLTSLFSKHNVQKRCLNVLNELRNRACHRGLFVLKVAELDQFLVMNILPLIFEILENTQYKDEIDLLYDVPSKLKIDPIKQLILLGKSGITKFDYKHIAFLKAISLVCCNYREQYFRSHRLSEKIATLIVQKRVEDAFECRECFVCGQNALILYRDGYETEVEGNYNTKYYVWKVECEECGLTLFNDVKNPKKYGIDAGDIWFNCS